VVLPPAFCQDHDKKILLAAFLLLSATAFAVSSLYDFTMPTLKGSPSPLGGFKGRVVLVVNLASQCGYTPQYEGLKRST
jgi:hypothetical protein